MGPVKEERSCLCREYRSLPSAKSTLLGAWSHVAAELIFVMVIYLVSALVWRGAESSSGSLCGTDKRSFSACRGDESG